MNRTTVCILVLTVSAFLGCRQNADREVAVVEPAVLAPASTTLTLSAEQLMALDWDGQAPGRPAVVDKRFADGGVEFDIHFPGNTATADSIDYASSGSGGWGALVGLNAAAYKAFALKFTLVSVTGQNKPDLPHEVVVGALIGPAGDGRVSAHEPLTLGFASGRTTAVATTEMSTQRVRQIGIHVHMANPEVWDAKGSVLQLRVEPAPGADVPGPPAPLETRESRRETRTESRREPRGESPRAPRKPTGPTGYTPDFGPSGLGLR